MLDLNYTVRWPKKTDTLFDQSVEEGSSYLTFSRGNDAVYAESYLASAELLLEDALKLRQFADMRIDPIMFLYRQHLELLLKGIIREGTGKEARPTHDLNALWTECLNVYASLGMDGYDSENKATGKLLAEFSAVDPGADSFRFPRDRKGMNTLRGLERINLANLKDVMKSLSAFLWAFLDETCDRCRGSDI